MDRNDEWAIVPGPASHNLGIKIAKELKSEIISVEYKMFQDGESKFRLIDDVKEKKVIIVQSTHPPVDTHILQLLMLAQKIKSSGGRVFAVIPYLAYSRQDREFLKGETVSLSLIASLLNSVGVERLITLDIHSASGLSYFTIPSISLSAVPLLTEYFKTKELSDPVAVSPDFGGSGRIEAFSSLLGIDFLVFKKDRDRMSGEVKIDSINMKLNGRDVIIVDDIISTGRSIEKAVKILKDNGARYVYVSCIHPILVENALNKLFNAGIKDIIGTNTIPSPISKIDVTSIISSYFSSL
jgi:ribose-phosphate pyrophosphokinase